MAIDVQLLCTREKMSERNVLTTIIVLLLPLSFGLDPGPGRDMPQNADMGYFSGENRGPRPHQAGSFGDLFVRPSVIPSVIPIEFAANSIGPIRDPGVFESSLSGNATDESVSCNDSSNVSDVTEATEPPAECSSIGAAKNARRFDIGFPLQESFNGVISTDDNRNPGDVGPIGGGRKPTPDTPIPTPEPGSLLTLACGLMALGGLAWKRSQHVFAEARSGGLRNPRKHDTSI